MNSIIIAARILFIFITAALLLTSSFVLARHDQVNGANALAVLGATVACIGVIASWHPPKD